MIAETPAACKSSAAIGCITQSGSGPISRASGSNGRSNPSAAA